MYDLDIREYAQTQQNVAFIAYQPATGVLVTQYCPCTWTTFFKKMKYGANMDKAAIDLYTAEGEFIRRVGVTA